MSAYTDNINLSPMRDGWWLTAPLTWEVGRKGSGLAYTVPAGFKSDLASIPAWARWLFSPADPKTAKAAVLHDAMLADGWSHNTAAAEFFEALKADGVSHWRRWAMWLGVVIWTNR